ncbi:hypothetical protein WJX81_005140 [Elliptochloris bilobata]|uniref:Protein kinase domain-containing protein n=1 Tax=Elliptochloris bilobata TaxID=381761 RepID=A0AAW1R2X4_9CHLO
MSKNDSPVLGDKFAPAAADRKAAGAPPTNGVKASAAAIAAAPTAAFAPDQPATPALAQPTPAPAVPRAAPAPAARSEPAAATAAPSPFAGAPAPAEEEDDREPLQRTRPKKAKREYQGAPMPSNEPERHAQLCKLGVLDSEPDPRFDDITKLLCSIFQVPIAIVSLVDTDRQWFKSIQGLPVCETSRKTSFCAWTLLPACPTVLLVPDARLDERFADNPLVTGPPDIRFYAGAPLVTSSGLRLGSLCVIDRQPRDLDAEQLNVLCNFAEVVVREIEKDAARQAETERMQAQTSGLLSAMDCFSEGIMLVNTATDSWDVLFVNDAWSRITTITREDALEKPVFELFPASGIKGKNLEKYREIVRAHNSFDMKLKRVVPGGGAALYYTAHFRPASTEALDDKVKPIGIPGEASWPSGKADEYYFVTVAEGGEEPVRANSLGSGASSIVRSAIKKTQPWEDVELGPLIGAGSFGKVYRGVWNGAHVAVKIIHMAASAVATPEAENGGDMTPASTMKGALEAMHSVDLSHPNIVQTYKSTQRPTQEEEEGCKQFTETWLVLEFCDRGNLQDAVDRGVFACKRTDPDSDDPPPRNLPAVVQTAREIASALTYLHSLDILHGDLSGGNILLASSNKDPRGFVAKVADFGLSRVLTAEAISTGTYGTVTHMPPELLTTGKLSKATDVYSFGVLLWELSTGKRPWAGMMQMQIIFCVTIQNKNLEFGDSVPPQLATLGSACLAKDAAQRPTFPEILKALDAIRALPL